MTRHSALATLLGLAAGLGIPAPARAQQDTLTLRHVLAAARERDPRLAQLALERERSAHRLGGLAAERLPSLRASAQAQYQSDVTSVGEGLPFDLPRPPHDTYDARLELRQPIYDPSVAPRRAVERAGLLEAEAQVEVALHAMRMEAVEAFYLAALMDERSRATEAAIRELETARRIAEARVREGTALGSEDAALRAEILRRRQDLDESSAERAAAIGILRAITDLPLGEGVVIAVDSAGTDAGIGPDAGDAGIARPELARFERARERIALRERALAAQDLPALSAYGRVGAGRPGLDMLGNDLAGWWVGGLQLTWAPRLWGAARRDRELLRIESAIVATEEAAFRERVERGAVKEAAHIVRLGDALERDAEIVALRASIERETRIRFEEGVVTAAELAERNGDLLEARIARAEHGIELQRARARYRITLGLEVE